MASIGFVTTSFPRKDGDAAGSFVMDMARAFARRGHAIDVVVPESTDFDEWKDAPDWLEGIKVFPARYACPRSAQKLFFGAGAPDNLSNSPWLIGLAPIAIAAMLAKAAIRSVGWDAVVSHWVAPSALVAGLSVRNRVKHLAVAHSSEVRALAGIPGGNIAAKAAVRLSDHLGFVSHGLMDEFLELLDSGSRRIASEKSSVVEMGVFPEALVPARNRNEIRKELGLSGFSVLFLGRLVPIKGVEVLIDAVQKLGACRLVIAGDGPLRTPLEKRAAEQGVEAVFLGSVDSNRRAELLAACDAVAVPSLALSDGRKEGLPVVLIEALHAGKPVVASATGAMEELVSDGVNGLLVRPGDAGAVAKALRSIRNDQQLCLAFSRSARESVAHREWPKLISRYEAILGVKPPFPNNLST